MWIELPPIWIYSINILGIPTVHLLVAWWSHKKPISSFDPLSPLFCSRSWEANQRIYEFLKVRIWKNLLPDAAAWFSGFAKASLNSTDPDYLRIFVKETCRGEESHWLQLLLILPFVLWTPFPQSVIIIVYAFFSNIPCILNLRQTRLRIQKLLHGK